MRGGLFGGGGGLLGGLGGGGGGLGGSGGLLGGVMGPSGPLGGLGLDLSPHKLPIFGGLFQNPEAEAQKAAMGQAAGALQDYRSSMGPARQRAMSHSLGAMKPADNMLQQMYGTSVLNPITESMNQSVPPELQAGGGMGGGAPQQGGGGLLGGLIGGGPGQDPLGILGGGSPLGGPGPFGEGAALGGGGPFAALKGGIDKGGAGGILGGIGKQLFDPAGIFF